MAGTGHLQNCDIITHLDQVDITPMAEDPGAGELERCLDSSREIELDEPVSAQKGIDERILRNQLEKLLLTVIAHHGNDLLQRFPVQFEQWPQRLERSLPLRVGGPLEVLNQSIEITELHTHL